MSVMMAILYQLLGANDQTEIIGVPSSEFAFLKGVL